MYIQKILKEKINNRQFYLEKIEKYLGSPLIKVLTWQRRVWKSSILKLLIQKLYREKLIPLKNFFYINKELPTFDNIKTYKDLEAEFKKFLQNTVDWKIFVWIDEIQEIENWEKFVNWLLAEYQENIEIFITGSNSFLLSWDLATYITWRYVEFHIFPLSFYEFCEFKKQSKTKQNFIEYLKYWGLPAIFKMTFEEEVIFWYLLGVYNTIVLKDIVQYHKIKNIAFFKDLYKYVLSNIWNIISWKAIKDYLKSQNISIWNETVLNFLQYAQDAYVLYKVYSVNPDTKKYFEIYNKYYAGDLWLRNALVGFDLVKDIGKLIENYVYLQLKRKWYSIKIWRLKSWKEIDFIAEKNGIVKYFQVCYLLNGESTIKREYSPLEMIRDNWEKYVVSFDEINFWIHNWIKHINVVDLEDII